MKKVRLSIHYLFLLATVLVLFSACGPKNETTATITLEALGSGPFFSGPNSAIAEYEVDFSEIEGLQNISKQQIAEIKVRTINLKLNDESGMNFDAFSSATLQLVSSTTGMQTIAIKNPIASVNQELTLQVSDEADIAEYFKSDKFSLVLDLDFLEDSYEDEIGVIVDMEISVKYN